MLIKIKASEGSLTESAIIELQGTLELHKHAGTHFENAVVGDLHFEKDGRPFMIIGHHILHGKIVKLDKPLVAIHKITSDDQSSSDPAVLRDSSVSYEARTIVRKKIVFSARPKPIVGSVGTIVGRAS